MSKANPSVPEHLDNPELARDIRALATRIEEQAHATRSSAERTTSPRSLPSGSLSTILPATSA